MSLNPHYDIELAVQSAVEEGFAILQIYDLPNLEIKLKEDNFPLTQTDIASNNIITGYVEKVGISIRSEENQNLDYSNRKDWIQYWVVDSLDRTKSLSRKTGSSS